ncbi:MAG TPA: LysE family transporter [Polyangiaceae bacterium]|jgi:threonine/homoserine/homoserine lactone efflux protein
MDLDFSLFRTGATVGFAVAAPVGPIGVLVIERSVREGRARGLVTGLGAAAADTVFALLGALGTSFAAGFAAQSPWLRLFGGAFLVLLGARAWSVGGGAPAAAAAVPSSRGHARAFLAIFALTLTNPATILSFAAVSAGLGVAGGQPSAAAVLAFGVLLGSAAWWLLLSSGAALFRGRVGPRVLTAIRIASGALLVAFGAAIILRTL